MFLFSIFLCALYLYRVINMSSIKNDNHANDNPKIIICHNALLNLQFISHQLSSYITEHLQFNQFLSNTLKHAQKNLFEISLNLFPVNN
jgi:hypothetical protein